jgi:hypothetical protein
MRRKLRQTPTAICINDISLAAAAAAAEQEARGGRTCVLGDVVVTWGGLHKLN